MSITKKPNLPIRSDIPSDWIVSDEMKPIVDVEVDTADVSAAKKSVVPPGDPLNEVQPECISIGIGKELCELNGRYRMYSKSGEANVSNFIVRQIEHRRFISGRGSIIFLEIQFDNGITDQIELTEAEYNNGNGLKKILRRKYGYTPYLNLSDVSLGRAIGHFSKNIKYTYYVESPGAYICAHNGKVAFVFSDGAIYDDGTPAPDIILCPPIDNFSPLRDPYLSVSCNDERTDPKGLNDAAIFFIEKIIKSKTRGLIALTVFAFIFASAYMQKLFRTGEQQFYLFLQGLTKTGKTTLVRVLMGFVGRFPSNDSFGSFLSTPKFLFSALSHLVRGLPVVFDNFRMQDMDKSVRKMLYGFLAGYADGVGRGRLTDKIIEKANAQLIITGENRGDMESGVINRGVHIPYPHGEYLLSVEDLQAFDAVHSKYFPMLFIRFLRQALQMNVVEIQMEIAGIREQFIKRFGVADDRMLKSIAMLYFSGSRGLDYFQVTYACLSEQDCAQLKERFMVFLSDILLEQTNEAEEMHAFQQFLDFIKRKLESFSRGYDVVEVKVVNKTTLLIDIPAFSKKDIFIMYDGKHIYINPVVALKRSGLESITDQTTLTRQLKEQGKLIDAPERGLRQYSIKVIFDDPCSKRYVKIDRVPMYLFPASLFNFTIGIEKNDESAGNETAENKSTPMAPSESVAFGDTTSDEVAVSEQNTVSPVPTLAATDATAEDPVELYPIPASAMNDPLMYFVEQQKRIEVRRRQA